MAGGLHDSSLTRVRPFFSALIDQDRSGEGWLTALLAAAPHGAELLDRLDGDPGTLLSPVTTVTDKGLLGCFEYPVGAPHGLLRWLIDHPDQLTWPAKQTFSAQTTKQRRALLYDEPRGREAAQMAAREELAATNSPQGKWWCFEGRSMVDCVLLTDRLVVTIEGKRTEPLSAATHWYPARSQLVRNLEAAKQLSQGREWASLLISEHLIDAGTDTRLRAVLAESAPHLDERERDGLASAYLGNTTWAHACAATGLNPEALPDTTAALGTA